MKDKLIVSPSPHIKDGATTSSVMLTVLAALTPAVIMSMIVFGLSAIILYITCIISCVVFEYLFRLAARRPNTISDCSAVVTGVLLAMNLPPTLPAWMAMIGSFVAIVVVKQMFGGIGENFANPAIVGRIVLFLSFSQPMARWLNPALTENGIELVSGATPLAAMAAGQATPSLFEMLMGLRGGSMGEMFSLALIVGGVYMIVKKVITVTTPLVFLGTIFLLSLPLGMNPVMQLLSGGAILGAFFMATDYASSPLNETGKAVFAFGCGLITMLIRAFGSYPEGVSFAILIMNVVTPHIDNLTRTKPFGGVNK